MMPTRELKRLRTEQAAAFVEPSWDVPLEVEMEVARVPEDATISGMFLAPVAERARELGRLLPSARERYTLFEFYSLREHVRLMFEAAQAFFPGVHVRQALRKLGRGATPALLDSTLGRVVWATAATPHGAVNALARSYGMNLRPGEGRVLDQGQGYAMVELKDVFYLLDSHHVGAFESVMRAMQIRPAVRVKLLGPGHAELLVTWPK